MPSITEKEPMPRAGLRSSGKTANAAAEMREHLKRLLAAEEVVLSAELAELLRHRELEWSCIPPLSRALMVPYLTLKETLRLDSAVTERGRAPIDVDGARGGRRGLGVAVSGAVDVARGGGAAAPARRGASRRARRATGRVRRGAGRSALGAGGRKEECGAKDEAELVHVG